MWVIWHYFGNNCYKKGNQKWAAIQKNLKYIVLAFEQQEIEKTVSRGWNHSEEAALLISCYETFDKTAAFATLENRKDT